MERFSLDMDAQTMHMRSTLDIDDKDQRDPLSPDLLQARHGKGALYVLIKSNKPAFASSNTSNCLHSFNFIPILEASGLNNS